jgi:ATP-dependent RNA helicase DeaD
VNTSAAPQADTIPFSELGLSAPVLQALTDIGYEAPSPIQAATIPVLMSGADVLGQAQTGTGKTAAFALPLLSSMEVKAGPPQALVLVPTRELAIQVAEAFQRYAAHMKGFHVLPIYGGQSYEPQLRGLRRGVHVVVGTPGRVMDHMKRGTLILDSVKFLVLDEADEMLQMGFVDAIEWILEQTPAERQVALFSATMPKPIRQIAQKHLRDPQEITIKSKTSTAANIRQRYWAVSGMHKLDALTRLLEVETFDGMLIFVRTKQATLELAERLEARGFAAAALNGDIPQAQRERTVQALKDSKIDILVATDVAARGLDVERIGHVVNFDIPYDTESYVHRIGRTGRAGRSGEAILFVAPRERNMLRAIERATRQPIEPLRLPSVADVNQQRIVRFKEKVVAALEGGKGAAYRELIDQVAVEHGADVADIAAALAGALQGDTPLLLTARDEPDFRELKPQERRPRPEQQGEFQEPDDRETYRIAVGYVHGVKPGNIVGAIANEANIDGRLIGHIDIREDHAYIDLPVGMAPEVLERLQEVRILKQRLVLTRVENKPPKEMREPDGRQRRYDKPAGGKPFGNKPFGGKPFEGKPFEGKPFEKKPFGKKPFEKKPYEKKIFAGTSPGGKKFGSKKRGPSPKA